MQDISVLDYIESFKKPAQRELVCIYTQGGCFAFYKLLKQVFPEAIPYKVVDDDGVMHHVVANIGQGYYDVRGEVDTGQENILPMTENDLVIAETFHYPAVRTNMIHNDINTSKCSLLHKIFTFMDGISPTVKQLELLFFTAFMLPGYLKLYSVYGGKEVGGKEVPFINFITNFVPLCFVIAVAYHLALFFIRLSNHKENELGRVFMSIISTTYQGVAICILTRK